MNAKWHDLIQRWLAGTVTDAEAAELQEALKSDRELRALYLEYANQDSALEVAANDASMRRSAVAEFPVSGKALRGGWRRHWWVPAAAAAAVAAITSWFLFVAPKSAKPQNLAVLTREAGAVWAETPPPQGQPMQSRWLKLRSGVAEVVLTRGARVLLEGPAEFQVASDNMGFLKSGKLHAYVPASAHGFVVRGDRFHATDKGTEFGCAVAENGGAEVHVFTGLVSVGNAGKAVRDLSAARAARVDETGIREIPSRPGAFIRDGDFGRLRTAGGAGNAKARWSNRASLSGHPTAVAHFDFEEGLPFQNLARADYIPNVAGCEIAEGRDPGSRALTFKAPDSCVRMSIPGDFNSLTLLAWVRVDALRQPQHSLLMGDSEQPGEIHWYLTGGGEMCFALIGRDRKWQRMVAAQPIRVQNPGAWHFLAATFDGVTTTLYLDGNVVGSNVFNGAGPLRLQSFEIGNWGGRPGMPVSASAQHASSPLFFLRAFEGRMDEFAILATALTGEEIRRLHDSRQTPPGR